MMCDQTIVHIREENSAGSNDWPGHFFSHCRTGLLLCLNTTTKAKMMFEWENFVNYVTFFYRVLHAL